MKLYRGRTFDTTKPVEVYRNLNKKGCWFSVKQGGLVVAHTEKFFLKDCTFVVRESGRQEFLRTGVKNVHAWVKGKWINPVDISISFSWGLYYDINKGIFTDSGNQMKLDSVKCVYHDGNKTKFIL